MKRFDYRFRYHNGQVRIHRTWFKMTVNPVLRVFGYQFASVFEDNNFIHYKFVKMQ